MSAARNNALGWIAPMLLLASCSASDRAAAGSQNLGGGGPGSAQGEHAISTPASGMGEYPTTAVLDAFRGACSQLQSLHAASQHVSMGGWTRLTDAANTPIANLVSLGRLQSQADGMSNYSMEAFQRQVAGENLYLVLTQVNASGRTVRTCQLLDGDETRRITANEVATWIGRQPNETISHESLLRAIWHNGFTPESRIELYHTPAGNPEFAGVALKAVEIDIGE